MVQWIVGKGAPLHATAVTFQGNGRCNGPGGPVDLILARLLLNLRPRVADQSLLSLLPILWRQLETESVDPG